MEQVSRERDYSDQRERDAEALAQTFYKPHRLGDTPAWFAACVTMATELLSLRERLETAEQTILDADHLCKWLLQGETSDADRERVVREYGVKFALAARSASGGV